MLIHLLKLTIIISLGSLFAIYSLNGSSVKAFSAGPFPSLTGAPGESDCRQCHGGGPTGGTLSINGLPSNYSPNQEITLNVTLAQQNRPRFGFQLTAIDDTGKRVGDLIPNDNRTQTQTGNVNGNQRQYINHTGQGTAPTSSGQGSWTFRWKAPAQSVGQVTFYVAGNAANGNSSATGDTIYTTKQSIQPGATFTNLVSVSAASFASNVSLTADGPDSDIVVLVLFGAGFRDVSSQSAATATIGGTAVSVLFAGEAPGFEGLDQANISIPRSLIGRGLVDVVFTADNKTANIVQINIE